MQPSSIASDATTSTTPVDDSPSNHDNAANDDARRPCRPCCRLAGRFAAGTDRFDVIDFHHVEFWCAAGRFSFALGVPLAAHSDLTTGNTAHASSLLRSRSGPLAFLFTAPYAPHMNADDDVTTAAASNSPVLPSFSADAARRFAAEYGLAVRAVAVRVSDAAEAYRASVAAGALPAFASSELGHGFVFAEVELYGDTVLHFVSYPDDTDMAFLPGFENIASSSECPDYGLNRFDHIVGGVPYLAPVVEYIAGFTGFHEFHRVNGDEIGTGESSLNGLVLANSSESVLLAIFEPVKGTKRRSKIQTFLDHHGGPGAVQHMAMTSDDIIGTLREIRARSSMGGFELLPPPPPSYYDGVRRLAGDVLSEAQINECQELGVRVDRNDDDGGVVLQTFTKAAGDSAVAVRVSDAAEAFRASVAAGAPSGVADQNPETAGGSTIEMSAAAPSVSGSLPIGGGHAPPPRSSASSPSTSNGDPAGAGTGSNLSGTLSAPPNEGPVQTGDEERPSSHPPSHPSAIVGAPHEVQFASILLVFMGFGFVTMLGIFNMGFERILGGWSRGPQVVYKVSTGLATVFLALAVVFIAAWYSASSMTRNRRLLSISEVCAKLGVILSIDLLVVIIPCRLGRGACVAAMPSVAVISFLIATVMIWWGRINIRILGSRRRRPDPEAAYTGDDMV